MSLPLLLEPTRRVEQRLGGEIARVVPGSPAERAGVVAGDWLLAIDGLVIRDLIDYGYQAVAKLTPMAKALIKSAYGKNPDRSYFGGCSNGGRHTFVAMTRMPEEYDGYLAGAPGYRLPLAAIANQFGAQRYASIATDLDALMKDRFLIGGPDQVVRALKPFVSEFGMTHLICRVFFPGMPHRHIMRELELIAKEVRPAFA